MECAMTVLTIDDRYRRPWPLIPLALAFMIVTDMAQAGETIAIPRYQPEIGKVATYRIEKTTETDMSLWFDKPEAASMVMRGDFRQQTAVISRDDKGMRMRWALSAALPPAAQSAADSYAMNPQYANSLAAYGLLTIAVCAGVWNFCKEPAICWGAGLLLIANGISIFSLWKKATPKKEDE